MITRSERYPISDLESSQGNETARHLFRIWQQSGTGETSDLDSFVPFSQVLLVLSKPCPDHPVSNLLFCGKNSMASKLAGVDLGKNSPSVFDHLPPDYSNEVSKGQLFSLNNMEPVYDFISSYLNGEKMSYERLLLPVKTTARSHFLICYSMAIALPEALGFGSSDKCQFSASQQNTYHSSPHRGVGYQTPTESRMFPSIPI